MAKASERPAESPKERAAHVAHRRDAKPSLVRSSFLRLGDRSVAMLKLRGRGAHRTGEPGFIYDELGHRVSPGLVSDDFGILSAQASQSGLPKNHERGLKVELQRCCEPEYASISFVACRVFPSSEQIHDSPVATGEAIGRSVRS